MKTTKAFLIFISLTSILFGQDMRQNAFSSIFSDQKGNRIGDAVTIIVVESSTAANNAETSSGRSSELGLNASASVGDNEAIPSIKGGIDTKNQFNGSGSTKTSGLIRTKISATIDSVLNNGNLHINGSKKIVINGEEQIITIKGIVRTSDIMADNSVLSHNISEAEITFKGDGIVSDAQKPGWLTKFFHWIF